MAMQQRRRTIKITFRGRATGHAAGTRLASQPVALTAVPVPHLWRWGDDIGRSFRSLLRSLGKNLPSCAFVILKLNSGGIL